MQSKICAGMMLFLHFFLSGALPAQTLDKLSPNWERGVKYYVRMSGNDSADGSSPARAFRTLTRALKQAGSGVTIIVGGGTYAEADTLYLSKVAATEKAPLVIFGDTTGKYSGDAGNVSILSIATSNRWAMHINGCTRVVLSGLQFVENPLGTYLDYSVVKSADAHNSYFQSASRAIWPYGVYLSSCSGTLLHNCQFHNHLYALYLESCADTSVTQCGFQETRYIQLYSLLGSGLRIWDCAFRTPKSPTYTNSCYSILTNLTNTTITNCVFDNTGNLYDVSVAELAKWTDMSPYVYRTVYQVYASGNGSDNNSKYSNTQLTVESCTFRNCTGIALCTSWIYGVTAVGNSFDNCRYNLQAHAEEINIAKCELTHPDAADWGLNDNWGIYATVFSAPTNHNPLATCRHDHPDPRGTVSHCALKNLRRGLLVASDNLELNEISFEGNTQLNDKRQFESYSQGIEVGWNCSRMDFSADQKLSFSNLWWCILASGNDKNPLECRFDRLELYKNWNGVYTTWANPTFTHCNLSYNSIYGAYCSWSYGFTAVNSEFSHNATNWYGVGLFVEGQKSPRRPAPAAGVNDPSWNWHTEYNVYGRLLPVPVTIQNCRFENNGDYGRSGEAGLRLARISRERADLSQNTVANNYSVGVSLLDCDLLLARQREFAAIEGNYYGIYNQGYWEEQTGHLEIEGYDIGNQAYGVVNTDSKLTIRDSRLHDNREAGVYSYSGQVTLDGVTCQANKYGCLLDRNSHHQFTNLRNVQNTDTGLWLQVTTQWPATAAYRGRKTVESLELENVVCNENLYGMTATSVIFDADSRAYPGNYTYPLKSLTCDNNRARGLHLANGWLDTTRKPLNISCSNNGYVVANANQFGTGDKYGVGIEFYWPQREIVLDASLGLTVNNNKDRGIHFYHMHYGIYDPATNRNYYQWQPHGVTVRNWNCASDGNTNWALAFDAPHHVTIDRATLRGGVYLNQPQGKVTVANSTIKQGWYGLQSAWGAYETWVANSHPDVRWKNPDALEIVNCDLSQNRASGAYIDSSYNWQTTNRRIPVSVANCSFSDNGWRGLESYALNITLDKLNIRNNGLAGALVWNGDATLTDCDFRRNCYGRWPDSAGKPQKWGATVLELTNPTTDSRRFRYLLTNCKFQENEGTGAYLACQGGTAELRNVSVLDSAAGSGIQAHYLDSLVADACLVKGTATNWAYYVTSVKRAEFANCQAVQNAYGMLAFGRYAQVGGNYVGVDDCQAIFTNCTATDQQLDTGSHGIYTAYNSTTIDRSHASRNKGYGIVCSQQNRASVTNTQASNNAYIGVRCDSLVNTTLRNNLITNNAYGVAFYNSPGTHTVWNNTIARNANFGLYAQNGSLAAHNNIISHNGPYGFYLELPVQFTGSHNLTFLHSRHYYHPLATDEDLKGTTGLIKPPRFKNLLGGDFSLAKGSPAINAGTEDAASPFDILGQRRGTYRGWEMGAYEFTSVDGSLRVLKWGEQK
ncbi:MAG: right-handed parallel beta-helix repeat-containing protein [Pirellulales bacterium]|nr:right-handed parallel beta-helix repeat-containing protein [Pirellulales bacterium]